MTAIVDTMDLARQERTDLAEFLANLTPQQWDAPTLCESWRSGTSWRRTRAQGSGGAGGRGA